tara:strand:- start:616 stop:795 length:180 start_codon:yes stop_codon:yes gene_type:complete
MAKTAISKGIRALSKGKFEARVIYQGKSSNAVKHSMYVGEYDTLVQAQKARQDFIINLF